MATKHEEKTLKQSSKALDTKHSSSGSSFYSETNYDQEIEDDYNALDDQTKDPELKETLKIMRDLQYIGFKPAEKRRKVKIEKKVKFTDVCKAVGAYIQVGNTPESSRKEKRAKPSGIGLDLREKIGIPFQQLAIAFMPILLYLRVAGTKIGKIKNKFIECTTPVELQDPALSGYKPDVCKDFMLRFDEVLKDTGPLKQKHGPDQVVRWLQIAAAGYRQDEEIHDLMNKGSQISFKDLVQWWDAIK
jgi:hypothetical protein